MWDFLSTHSLPFCANYDSIHRNIFLSVEKISVFFLVLKMDEYSLHTELKKALSKQQATNWSILFWEGIRSAKPFTGLAEVSGKILFIALSGDSGQFWGFRMFHLTFSISKTMLEMWSPPPRYIRLNTQSPSDSYLITHKDRF